MFSSTSSFLVLLFLHDKGNDTVERRAHAHWSSPEFKKIKAAAVSSQIPADEVKNIFFCMFGDSTSYRDLTENGCLSSSRLRILSFLVTLKVTVTPPPTVTFLTSAAFMNRNRVDVAACGASVSFRLVSNNQAGPFPQTYWVGAMTKNCNSVKSVLNSNDISNGLL